MQKKKKLKIILFIEIGDQFCYESSGNNKPIYRTHASGDLTKKKETKAINFGVIHHDRKSKEM